MDEIEQQRRWTSGESVPVTGDAISRTLCCAHDSIGQDVRCSTKDVGGSGTSWTLR